ncbi:3-oxoacyl-[acyl-carrier-protein] synthase, mitochondrial isoform X4 [Magnolia sinica]|uniref:3-oxoacyl-[acyl-carrier-protein] synthase, mitochondrial isoform X4 n=1 Tax=Magnolia sinica TaxID=86752 RepID=UPI002658EAA6|nr:3-oxoacyl-[acyl-carrier-protein] synthase, mitochondrial isoform X4 [Magnolia sinica]
MNHHRRLFRHRFQISRCFSSPSLSFDPPPAILQRRVVVTGLGMVTPLGCGVETTWRRLIDGRCGIRALTPGDLKMEGFDKETTLHTFEQLVSKVAAIVPSGTDEGEFNEEIWLRSKRLRRLSPFFIPRILINMAAGHVSMKYGFKVPNHAAVTACATGAHSIGDAARMIQFGDSDVMVAGGTESSIDALSIAGFCITLCLCRSRALTTKYNSLPKESSRPFDCDRDGFVIGEGSGIMVLEELEHARDRGAKIYAEVRGYGMSGDAHHITQPHTDGRGAILAMTRALGQSGIHPNQVDYVNAHATSTPLGDAIEASAIESMFSDHATSGTLALSSTKGATGHLLGAAGAVEAIFAVLAIHHGIAPPTLNLENPDPIFHDGFKPLSAPMKMPIRAALSNSFGFGGTNASLLFACPP